VKSKRFPSRNGQFVQDRPNQSPALAWFFIVAGVAFVLRLIHLLQLRHNDPLFFSPQMDSLYHHQWALAIASGREFIADAFFRAPLYPYFLGLLYKVFGANLLVVRIIQALIGSAGCGLVYLLARQLLRPRASSPKPHAAPNSGVHPSSLILHPSSLILQLSSLILHPSSLIPHPSDVAGFVMAAYPLAIWFDGELLLEGLLTFLVLLGFVLLLRSRDTDRQWWLPGIVFGLAAITRPNVLAFLAVLPAWLFVEYRTGSKGSRVGRDGPRLTEPGFKSRARPPEPATPRTLRTVRARLALVWGAAAIVILPVTIRNYVVSGQFVPIAWQAGTNFYIGNSAESDGVTAILPGTRPTWWGGYSDVRRLAEEAAGRPLKGPEIDRYWLGKGLEFWRRQTGKALGLLARKTFIWFAGREAMNDRDLYRVKHYSFINYLFFTSKFLKFPFGILLPLALAGVWLWRREWRRFLPVYLFVGAYSLSFIVFFVTSRYRTSIVPFLAILGGMGLIGLIRPMRGRGVALAIAVAAFLFFNANLAGAGRQGSPGQNHIDAAIGLHEQGRDAEAVAELREALKLDSATGILSFEADLLAAQGEFAEAERAGRAAIRLHPSDADGYGILGNVFAYAGRFDSAAVYFQALLERSPYELKAWNNLGNIALLRRDFERARYYYEGALKLQPTDAQAMYSLGLCDYYEGKVAEARALWQQALKLDPSFTKAKQALEQKK
jgi:4-amino-4-deoxy-L-arabinose transferase-like glycosyltransferase